MKNGRLKGIIRQANRITQTVSAAILILAVVVLLSRPVFRHYHVLTLWIEPLAQLVTIWITFLMLSNVETSGRHIQIEYFVERFGERSKRLVEMLTIGLGVYVTVFIMVSSVFATINLGQATITGLPVRTWILHIAPLIGMSLLFLNYLDDGIRLL